MTNAEIALRAAEFAGQGAEELLRWCATRFPLERTVLASSLGPEDVVLIDLFAELGRFPRVVTIDTGRLPPETLELMDRVRRRYGLALEVLRPDPAGVADMVRRHGPDLFYESAALRRLCCRVRKVSPLRRALAGAPAWIAGLRREQSPGRAAAAKIEWDKEFGLVKFNPLADWTETDVWRRVRERNLPYNALHDAGYPSVGCAPCTRAVKPGEDPRSGRWWWEPAAAGRECGLHPAVNPPKRFGGAAGG